MWPGGAEYRLVTTWRLEAGIEEVFRVLGESGHWPSWWKGLATVEPLASGDADGIGRVDRYTWHSPLGYGLRFDLRVTRVEPPWLIEGVASGDVEGVGCWRLSEEGLLTRVRHEWRVRTVRRWMNLAARVAQPLFTWSHHVVMRNGAIGLARRLEVPLVSITHG